MAESINPKVFGKYEVIRRLAVGGMGEIFLARQTGMAGFDRLVILKSLLPQLASDGDMLTQFLDEARIVGNINHPNVVACYEVGEWEGVYFIAMEYINGVDIAMLQKVVDDQALRFPINVAMTIAREAALGLDSAHQAHDSSGRALKIVHRDISPHNVMVRQDGLTKIVDFGVAVAANRQKRTEGGLLKGKLGYMAPEQIKGQPLDGRGDQFSLGVMLWELLSGRRLFTAEDPHAVFMKIVREVVPPPSQFLPDVPPELDAIVLRMTSQEPADRYPRLAEAAAALRKLLDQRGAQEGETAETVHALVGGMLAERIRDLTPMPVRILGVSFESDHQLSSSFCKSCGAQAVKGDRFCRSCGSALGSKRGTPAPSVPPVIPVSALEPPAVGAIDHEFAEVADDMIDVAFDDSTGPAESGVCVGVMELVDGVGVHAAPETMLRAVYAHIEELAARFGGTVTTSGQRITASFTGNGRAARSAVAFARRATVLATRANRDLRMRAGVAAAPGLDHGDTSASNDAERAVLRAKPGAVLVSEGARKLAAVAHFYGPAMHIAASGGAPAMAVHDLPLPPRLAGRAGERIVIEQAIAAADIGRGQQHLFLGPSGCGKTALLEAVDAEARDRGFIIGRAACLRTAVRYDAVRQTIRSACLELVAVAGVEGAVWHKSLDGLSLSPGDRVRLVALVDGGVTDDADIPLARRRVLLRASVLGFFAALAERRGACVILDDVHRGDPSSLEVFAEVGARLNSARFAIFATGRPMQGERVLPLAKRTLLEPLEPKENALVASLVAGGALPDAVADKLAAHANGSPLIASLLVRHLVAVRLLHVDRGFVKPSADLDRYPLPPSLEVLLFACHALLSKEAREVLVAGAQIGGSFDAAEVAAMIGADPAAALAECVGAAALTELQGRFSFPTSSEREVLVARAAPDDARRWNERVAALLESRPDPSSQRSIESEERIAFHFGAAGDKDRAAAASERAADRWTRLGAVDAVADSYKKALHARWKALGVDAAKGAVTEQNAVAALELASRATLAVGEIDPAAAVDLVMPIVRLLPDNVLPKGAAVAQRVEALRARALVLLKLRRGEEASRILDEALDGFAADAGPALSSSLLIEVAAALEQSGHYDSARLQLREALRQMGSVPVAERSRAGEALLALGKLDMRARDLPAARESLMQALEEARRRGSATAQVDALTALSLLEQVETKGPEALKHLDEALAVAAKSGDAVVEARLRQQLARTHQQAGRTSDALAAARLALSAAQRLAWDEGTAVAGQLVATLEQRT